MRSLRRADELEALRHFSTFAGSLVDPGVDLADLPNPQMALVVLHIQDLVDPPVEVVGDVGYLTGELVQRVAYDSPTEVAPVPMSTWNS